MDNRVVTTVRLPAALAEWLAGEARRRGVSKTVVVQAALECARDGVVRPAVEELEDRRPVVAQPKRRAQAPPNYMLERQARLRREMGWDK